MMRKRAMGLRGLTTAVFTSLLVLGLTACGGGGGGGSSNPDINESNEENTTFVAPTDYESQPTYAGVAHIYTQDSDSDLVADVNDPSPSDPSVSGVIPYNESEFNNNITDADVIGTQIPIYIEGSLAQGSTYYLDSDYFRFTAHAGERLSIIVYKGSIDDLGSKITLSAQSFSPNVSLIDANGAVVRGLSITALNGDVVGIGVVVPSDGSYYVEVSDPEISAQEYDYGYVVTIQADSDFDGVSDALETTLESNKEATDSDEDGLNDFDEIYPLIVINPGNTSQGTTNWWDVDADGTPNWWDVDADGDGPPDRLEGALDLDGDAIANFLDTDANNDGTADTEEVGESFQQPVDTDNDGLDDYMDLDGDNDGIPATLDTNDTTVQEPTYMFGDSALSVLAVRAIIDENTTLIDTCLLGNPLWIDAVNITQNTQVLFPVTGGTKALTPSEVNSTGNMLKVTVPPEAQSGILYLYDSGNLSNGYDITVQQSSSDPYLYAPTSRTQAGATLVLNGHNLSNSQVTVSFVNAAETLTATGTASGDSVSVTVPYSASSGQLYIEAGGKVSNSVPLSVIDTHDATVELPSGTSFGCSDIQITQYGVETYADAQCNISGLEVDNNGIDFVSIFYKDDNDEVHLLYETVVLPTDWSLTFNSLSTATKLVFFNLGYHISQPKSSWSGILNTIQANSDVTALAAQIDLLLQTDPEGYSQFTDATLITKFQTALISSAQGVAQYYAPRRVVQPDITPAQVQNNVYLTPIDPADIKLQNDTKTFLSVNITDTSGKTIGYTDAKGVYHPYTHIKHPWDSNIIGPQGWGLLLISTDKEFKINGRDSHFDVAAGGFASPLDSGSNAYKYVIGRTLFDGVAAPVMNKVLEKIIGQKFESEEAAKVLIEVLGPSAWNNFVSDVVTKKGDFFTPFNLYIAQPFNAVVGSCFQVPVGDTCKTLTLSLAKHLGLTDTMVKRLLIKTVGKEIAAYIVPGVNAVKATYEVLDKINFAGTMVITAYDIGTTPGNIDFDVDYPLEIEEVKPMCLIKESNEQLLLKGKGFLPYTSGSLWWKKEVQPSVTLDAKSGEVKAVNTDGTSMLVNFGTSLASMTSGAYTLSVTHQGQTATFGQSINVASDGIILDAISPSSGSTGSAVTLSGCGFAESASQNSVWFTADGGSNIAHTKATVLSSTADSLVVVVPDDAITGGVYVEAGDMTSNTLNFTVESANVTITYGDNGAATDDTFALYVDNVLVSTMASPSWPFPVSVELAAGTHTVKLLGITAPDEIGTYGISFSSNVSVVSGPSLSGSDLSAGVVKSWQIEVTAASSGPALDATNGTAWKIQPE